MYVRLADCAPDILMKQQTPILWQTICDMIGGEDRLEHPNAYLGNDILVNLGVPSDEPDGWHKDGWHYRHFLDSSENGLLIISIFIRYLSSMWWNSTSY